MDKRLPFTRPKGLCTGLCCGLDEHGTMWIEETECRILAEGSVTLTPNQVYGVFGHLLRKVIVNDPEYLNHVERVLREARGQTSLEVDNE